MVSPHTKDEYYAILHRREQLARNRPLGCRIALKVESDLEQEFLRESEPEDEIRAHGHGSMTARRKLATAAARYNPRRAFYAKLAHAKEPVVGNSHANRARSSSPPSMRQRYMLDSMFEPTPQFMRSWRKRHAAALKENKVHQFLRATQKEIRSSLDDGFFEQQLSTALPETPQTWPRRQLDSQFTLAATPVSPPYLYAAMPSSQHAPSAPSPMHTFPPEQQLCAQQPAPATSSFQPSTATPPPQTPTLPPPVMQQAGSSQRPAATSAPPAAPPQSPPPQSALKLPLQPSFMLLPPASAAGGRQLSTLEQAQEEMRASAQATSQSLQELLLHLQHERAAMS